VTSASLHALPGADAMRRACLPGGAGVVVQPLVRLSDGELVGFEALGRVVDDRGLGPAAWLGLAADHGLRVELELAFLRAACDIGPVPGEVPLFVNASAATLLDPRIETVRTALPRHVLELSEHDRIEDYAQLLPRLRAWRAQGTRLAVDDVGAGYANMAHVLQLDPAFVKIDRFIVAGVDRDPRRRALVAALHTLASASGAASVAEGVERPEELAVLRELGVDIAQGYLLARPGRPWPALNEVEPVPAITRVDVSGTSDAHEISRRVSATLAADEDLLPSVYLARGGLLRCVARHGQWLVLDGIEPGMGLTGSAYARDEEVLVHDVLTDPRYRQAVPGVRSELAIPLHAAGRLVGVLNVDARRRLTTDDVFNIRRAAVTLEQRLSVVGVGEDQDSPSQRLGRTAPAIAMADTSRDLARATVRAALALGGFDTACLWSSDGSGCAVEHAMGIDARLLARLEDESVEGLRELVRDAASVYSAGPDLDLASGPTDALRRSGVRGVLLVPLRDGRQLTGFLLLTRRAARSAAPPELVLGAEMIGLLAGSRSAALRRLAQLERRAARDPLTGVGNRSRLDALINDRSESALLADGWLAALDLDRFKQVNDQYGHAAGDEVLRAVATSLLGGPGSHLVVRLGGDEFAVLLSPCSEESALQACAEMRERMRHVLTAYGADISIGLAQISADGRVDLALVHADEALYLRKRSGGGGVTGWSAEIRPPSRADAAPGERRAHR
jgi:diguanylate cyclase (GGDEF)-like protein